MTYYDILAHRRSDDPDVLTILAIAVDASTEDLEDDLPCCVGVHPKSIDEDVDDVLFIARDLAHEDTVVAVGECGLDRAIPVGWVDQMRVFEDQVSFSELLCKPLIVHCVRAHADVVTLFRELQVAQPWVIHDFNKGADTLERVIDAGLFVSFGASVMQDNSPAAESVAAVPANRFFLETGNQHSFTIKEIYDRVAHLRGVTVEELGSHIHSNYDSVFKQ
jgi:TatD DNase family protein